MRLENEWIKSILEKIAESAQEIGYTATDKDKEVLIEFYNQQAIDYLNNGYLKDIFNDKELFSLLDALMYDLLAQADCKDENEYIEIVSETIDMVFEKIRNKNTN